MSRLSVTRVMDYLTERELLEGWYLKNGEAKRKKIQDEALRVGSLVDSLIQQDIREGGYLVPEGDTPVVNCLKGWEKFKKDCPMFIETVKEMQIELKDGELIGHPDFVIDDGMRKGIIDLKCARSIQPRYWTQTAQYLKMNGGGNFIGVLRLEKTDENGLYEYQENNDLEYIKYEWKVFEAYLTAYHHNKNNREAIRKMLEDNYEGVK